MDASMAPGARTRAAPSPRCPECGSGDLFLIDVTRRDGGVWQGAYCAGVYDHERHRLVERSCGFAGARTHVTSAPSPPASPADARQRPDCAAASSAEARAAANSSPGFHCGMASVEATR